MSSSSSRPIGGEILTLQCGPAANWIGAQYHTLQNSNSDVNSMFARSAHFRRSEGKSSTSGSSSGNGDIWTPRVVSLDSSVGLDGIVATFALGEDDTQDRHEGRLEEIAKKARAQQHQQQKANKPKENTRPRHWSELSHNVYRYHDKSLYSVPGLYEGTNDFHLFEQGQQLMEREQIHEDVIDRARWFLEECDQPDGIHLIIDGNTGWSGVGASLLSLIRDEYEKIPIFCISSLLPPEPSSTLGRSFSSNTSMLQSVLNSSLLMETATQLASAYLPLTTHYWASSPLAQSALPDVHTAIQRGELYESSTLLAWALHLTTAEYRLFPRSQNMAIALAGLTQQSQANIVAARLMTQEVLDQQATQAASSFDSSASSSTHSGSPVVHSDSSSIPLSLIGHNHSFTAPIETDSHAPKHCGILTDLTESAHVFGRTEEMSHQMLIQKLEKQPPAMFRKVYGTSRMNLPPSWPVAFYDLLNNGHVLSCYRCRSLGSELSQFGSWLTSLNKGTLVSSNYKIVDGVERQIPKIIAHMEAPRKRNPNDRIDGDGERTALKASEQFNMTQWSQDELDLFMECGTTMQNLAELY